MNPSAATRGRPPRNVPRRTSAGWGFVGPGVFWLILFVVAPLLLMLGVSFLSRGEYGGVTLPFTFANYRRLAGWDELGFDALYPHVLLRTVMTAAGVTALCLVAALPLAFFVARRSGGARGIALLGIVVPFWTNLLIRTYAWQILLGAGGPLASIAAAAGWIPRGTGLYPGWMAVMTAMACDFLPFMTLPIYASVERIDWGLAEAAADLGANRVRAFRHAVLPQILPGIRAGVAMVFLPALGQFVIPDLLGGGRVTLLGNLIQQQFGASRDWPFGSAAACILLVTLMLVLLVGRRGTSEKEVLP